MTRANAEVRRAGRQDIAGVLALWAGARSGHASLEDRPEDVERLLDDGGPAALFVAECDEDLVGALIAGWDGWRGNLYRLAVKATHRRQGIGLALTRAAEDYFGECGGRRATALVAFADDEAGSFWDSAGYPLDREIGRRARNIGPADRR